MKVAAGCFIPPSLRGPSPHVIARSAATWQSFLSPPVIADSAPPTSLRGAQRRGNLSPFPSLHRPVIALSRHCRLDRQSVSHHQSTNQSKSCLMVSFSVSVHAFSPPSVNKTAQNLPVGPVDVHRQNSQPVMLRVIASGRVHHVIARSAATWQSVPSPVIASSRHCIVTSLHRHVIADLIGNLSVTVMIPRLVALTWNDSETTGCDSETAAPVADLSPVGSVDPQTLVGHHQSTNLPKTCLMVSFSASAHCFLPPSVNKTVQNLPVGPEFSICQRGNGRSAVKLL